MALVCESRGALVAAIFDGSGHGPEAADAAELARSTVLEDPSAPPAKLLERCHAALISTRGASIGILRLAPEGAGLFAGVGNVAVVARSAVPIRVISQSGIVGHRMRKLVEYAFRWAPGDLIAVHSDGLSSRLDLEGLDPQALDAAARQLVDRFGQLHDDVSLILISP